MPVPQEPLHCAFHFLRLQVPLDTAFVHMEDHRNLEVLSVKTKNTIEGDETKNEVDSIPKAASLSVEKFIEIYLFFAAVHCWIQKACSKQIDGNHDLV
mmetsp:Transcript_16087/g.32919  ORF Transcript_16087/g.32919 Transcript_16087/m.32919 type:complete len:98 (+) Transcript_16087:8-301(+)